VRRRGERLSVVANVGDFCLEGEQVRKSTCWVSAQAWNENPPVKAPGIRPAALLAGLTQPEALWLTAYELGMEEKAATSNYCLWHGT
jgi:hypothetical protein